MDLMESKKQLTASQTKSEWISVIFSSLIFLSLVYNMDVMKYVFFDCECANCLQGEGKICSLGYVLTDENFQILKKKDIIINPDAPFYLGNAKNGEGIKLAYPLFRFKWSHTFPYYYQEIKNLFNKEEIIAFGFAVFQDVAYLTYTCRRYNLPIIKFDFYDIQEFEKQINQRKNPSGLDHLIEQYQLTPFTYHESDDDALMTLEVFKKLLEENNISVQQAMEKYPSAYSNVDSYLKEAERRKLIKEAKKKKAKAIDDFFVQMESVSPSLDKYDPMYYKKNVYFHYAIFSETFDYLYAYGKELRKRGANLVRNPMEADFIIVKPHTALSNTMKTKETMNLVRIDTLKRQLKIKD